MQTTYSKSVHLDGLVFDPNAELDLTDEQREEMESEWKDIVRKRINEILEPYGAVILGNDEILIDTDRYGEFVDVADEIFQEIGLTDFDEDGEFFDRWADTQWVLTAG